MAKATERDERERQSGEDRLYFTPAADIYETKDDFVVVMDMPGVGKDDLNVTVEENELGILGKVNDKLGEGKNFVRREYRIGDYRRKFSLSNVIDRDKVNARLENGVLTLALPKSERIKPREIKIENEK